jgi:hypothetical protein
VTSKGGMGKTTAELQRAVAPGAGIYTGWSCEVWDFGTASQYPALKYDTNGDGRATAYEFGGQGRSGPPTPYGNTDYDTDDGLIEVANWAQLDAIRHDPKGGGNLYVCNPAGSGYNGAFPDAMAGMGCGHLGDHDGGDATPDQAHCHGYELTADLDFDTDGSGSVDSGDQYWDDGMGWKPLPGFMGTLEGNRHVIHNLCINRPDERYVGLFGWTYCSARGCPQVRNLGLEGAMVQGFRIGTGGDRNVHSATGTLAGVFEGRVSRCYATGMVQGAESVGGLVGSLYGFVHVPGIAEIYAAVDVSNYDVRHDSIFGGLVGNMRTNTGYIRASYATGSVSGPVLVGGLVDRNSGFITAAYSTGNIRYGGLEATGGSPYIAGGLVGANYGKISASYTLSEQALRFFGERAGGYIPSGYLAYIYGLDSLTSQHRKARQANELAWHVGGLVGHNLGEVSASYWQPIQGDTFRIVTGGNGYKAMEL